MPYATRKVCPFPGCAHGAPDDDGNPQPFMTPEGIATRQEVNEELKDHVHMAHELILEHKKLEVGKINAEATKIQAEAAKLAAEQGPAVAGVATPRLEGQGRVPVEKRAVIPRPQVEEGITESDWSFFDAQWTRYKASTGLSDVSETQHLWAACAESLQRSLHNAGAGRVTVAKELMEKIKGLAIKK